jgi:hypothetical protein
MDTRRPLGQWRRVDSRVTTRGAYSHSLVTRTDRDPLDPVNHQPLFVFANGEANGDLRRETRPL